MSELKNDLDAMIDKAKKWLEIYPCDKAMKTVLKSLEQYRKELDEEDAYLKEMK